MLPIYHEDGKPMIAAFDVHQFIPKSSPWAQQAPYVGGKLAAMTNMMPFTKGQYVPVHVRIGQKEASYGQTVEGSHSPTRRMYNSPDDTSVSQKRNVFGTTSIGEQVGAQIAATVGSSTAATQPTTSEDKFSFNQLLSDIFSAAPSIITAVKGPGQSTASAPITYTTPSVQPSAGTGGTSMLTVGLIAAGVVVTGAVAYSLLRSPSSSASSQRIERRLNRRNRRSRK